MSHRIARQVIARAVEKLRRHKSGDPEFELEDEKIEKLREEIEEAQNHLEDEDDE